MKISRQAALAARQHAIDSYPQEAVGVIKDGAYVACQNIATDTRDAFRLAGPEWGALQPVEALIHSHPDGPDHPSALDMEQQLTTGIPWGLTKVWQPDKDAAPVAVDPWFWGEDVTPPPLIGRDFRPGPSGTDGRGDCYALIRDAYRASPEELAAIGAVDWPHPPTLLVEGPRDDAWWLGADRRDLYVENFERAGFEVVLTSRNLVKPGDVLLMKLLSPVVNHGMVYLGNALILHHKPRRLSCTEPVHRWFSDISLMLRYKGASSST